MFVGPWIFHRTLETASCVENRVRLRTKDQMVRPLPGPYICRSASATGRPFFCLMAHPMCIVSFAHSIGNYQISIMQLPSLRKTHPQIVQKSGWSFPNVKHQVSTVTRKKRRKLKQKMDMCLVNSFKSSTLCCCYSKLTIQVDTLINIIIEIKVKCSFLSEDPWTRDKASHSNGVALATQKKKKVLFF